MNRMTVNLAISFLVCMVLSVSGGVDAFMFGGPSVKEGHEAYDGGNYPAALAVYHELAGRGDIEAQYYLASMYSEGKGTAKDETTAARWMKQSADSGYTPAQFSMGLKYLRGTGVSKDPGRAVAYFQEAAQADDADAQYFLAFLSAIGHGTVKDPGQALRWFRLAKSNGFPVSNDLLTPEGVAELSKAKWIGR